MDVNLLQIAIQVIIDALRSLIPWDKLSWEKFKTKSKPIEYFSKKEAVVILSSLLSVQFSQKFPSLIKPWLQKNNRWNYKTVKSGSFVTGINDAFALAKLTGALLIRKTSFELKLDNIKDSDKSKNLILIGGPVSNSIARELYVKHLNKQDFYFNHDYSKIIYGTVTLDRGNHGIILYIKNPWNPEKRIMWFAGLGAAGTHASVNYLLEEFEIKTPKKIKNSSNWVIFVEGVMSSDGGISESNNIGCKILD